MKDLKDSITPVPMRLEYHAPEERIYTSLEWKLAILCGSLVVAGLSLVLIAVFARMFCC